MSAREGIRVRGQDRVHLHRRKRDVAGDLFRPDADHGLTKERRHAISPCPARPRATAPPGQGLAARRQERRRPQARIRAVSERLILTSAQLAIAREYGFPSWPRLKTEVERREILSSRDLSRLSRLLAEQPELATVKDAQLVRHKQAGTVAYMAMLRFDSRTGPATRSAGTGRIAKALIDAGAPVEGHPERKETPLITAASYGDADVAKVLIEAGADIEARSAPTPAALPAAPRCSMLLYSA